MDNNDPDNRNRNKNKNHKMNNTNNTNNTILVVYQFAFFALSGLGLTFLNPESILALCFFIFFTVILQNSESISAGLEISRQAIEADLVELMINEEENRIHLNELHCLVKLQSLIGLGQMESR